MVAKEKPSCIPRFALWTPDGTRGKLVTSLGITWGSFRLVGSEMRLMYMTWAVSQDYPHVPWASLLQVCGMGKERDRGFGHQNITSSIFYLQGSHQDLPRFKENRVVQGNIDPSFFFTLWQNTHSINFIIINVFVHGSVALNTFTLLCSHRHYPCLELFSSSQMETPHPLNTNSSSLGLTSC